MFTKQPMATTTKTEGKIPVVERKIQPVHPDVLAKIVDAMNLQTGVLTELRRGLQPKIFRIPAAEVANVNGIIDSKEGVIDSIFPQQNTTATNLVLKIDDIFEIPLFIGINGIPLTGMSLRFDHKIAVVSLDNPVLICGRFLGKD